jgi:hypothetical protein
MGRDGDEMGRDGTRWDAITPRGWVEEASGGIQEASGGIQEASGGIHEASGGIHHRLLQVRRIDGFAPHLPVAAEYLSVQGTSISRVSGPQGGVRVQ